MSAEELRDWRAQPAAEQRRRLDAILALHPQASDVRILRLRTEGHLADFDGVIADSDVLLADTALDRRVRLDVLVQRAEALLQVHRDDEALAAADEAVHIDDADSGALFARGWARHRSRQDELGALADLSRALQLEPDQGIGYFRRATVFQWQARFQLAREDFERALKLAPGDEPTRLQYGVMLFENQDFDRARAQFAMASRLAPNDGYANLWHFIARVRLQLADEAAAKEELAALAPPHRPHEWTDTLVDLMLGKSTLEAALVEADAADTYKLKAGHRCEADFYAAEQLLARGQEEVASRLLEEGYWLCPSSYLEAHGVAAERRRFAARSPTR